MNTLRMTAIGLLTCLPLLGCGKDDPTPAADPANEPTTFIGKAVKEATDEARPEISIFPLPATPRPKSCRPAIS
jgi:hypothetical protein